MRTRQLASLLALGVHLAGCNAVLGLEELPVDAGDDATNEDATSDVVDTSVDTTVGDTAADGAVDTGTTDAADAGDAADAKDASDAADANDASDASDASDAADGADVASDAADSSFDTDPCSGVLCNAPPASTCTDSKTRHVFASTGTCSGGSCTYGASDVACTSQACVGGACVGSCSPGAKRCNANVPQTCDSSGVWQGATACSNQTCIDGVCQGVCGPGQKSCVLTQGKTCDATGNWLTTDLSAPKWTKTYGTTADESIALGGGLVATSDGDFQMVGPSVIGTTTSTYAVKVGPDGTKRWDKTQPNVAAYALGALSDGTIGCGQIGKPNLGCTSNRSCGYCVRYALDGTVTWEKAYNAAGGDIQQFYGVATSPTGFVAVGDTTDTDAFLDGFARGFDLAGVAGFTTSFPQTREDNLDVVRRAADGSYWAGGYIGAWSACQQAYVVHFNAGGTKIAEKGLGPCINNTSGSGDRAAVYDVLPLSDGSVIVVGVQWVSSAVNSEAFIAKWTNFDTSPTEAWRKTFGGAGDDEFWRLEPLADGYVAVGQTLPGRFGASAADAWVVKVGLDGTLVWSKTYGGTGDDKAASLVRAADGSYLIAGHTSSSGAGGKDFWLMNVPIACP
ncbi:MAG: hypothetical protein HYV09_30820 [Deltaproteobacteria bacterium]|nr:hypothetical protein [Deltaproteobacteria bacterium]